MPSPMLSELPHIIHVMLGADALQLGKPRKTSKKFSNKWQKSIVPSERFSSISKLYILPFAKIIASYIVLVLVAIQYHIEMDSQFSWEILPKPITGALLTETFWWWGFIAFAFIAFEYVCFAY